MLKKYKTEIKSTYSVGKKSINCIQADRKDQNNSNVL